MVITIDGPSGSGKGTTASLLALKTGFYHLDSGALYRAVVVHMLESNIHPDEVNKISAELRKVNIKILQDAETKKTRYILNSRDITEKIRMPEVSKIISAFAKISEVREFVKNQQRMIAKKDDIIAEGRDMGTEIFPNAELKVYLTADLYVRAKRRFLEIQQIDSSITLEEVQKDIEMRDFEDMNRKVSPLRIASDAILLDNTNLTIQDQVQKIYDWYLKLKNEEKQNI